MGTTVSTVVCRRCTRPATESTRGEDVAARSSPASGMVHHIPHLPPPHSLWLSSTPDHVIAYNAMPAYAGKKQRAWRAISGRASPATLHDQTLPCKKKAITSA